MSHFFNYFLKGFQKGIIIGVPDFEQNNLYLDIKNIGGDFYIAIQKVIDEKEQQNSIQPKEKRK
ncbi:MAG: hypothetical protein GXO61_04490 [Epsilonproteobacteria bacterium]|nr:hypothetical protein [Campylobacterota bacterium]